MGKLKVGIKEIKIVDILRQEVTKEQALQIERFTNENRFELVVDIKSSNNQYMRFELDRRSAGTPFIVIDQQDGIYTIGGRVRGLYAEYFLEEFCNE